MASILTGQKYSIANNSSWKLADFPNRGKQPNSLTNADLNHHTNAISNRNSIISSNKNSQLKQCEQEYMKNQMRMGSKQNSCSLRVDNPEIMLRDILLDSQDSNQLCSLWNYGADDAHNSHQNNRNDIPSNDRLPANTNSIQLQQINITNYKRSKTYLQAIIQTSNKQNIEQKQEQFKAEEARKLSIKDLIISNMKQNRQEQNQFIFNKGQIEDKYSVLRGGQQLDVNLWGRQQSAEQEIEQQALRLAEQVQQLDRIRQKIQKQLQLQSSTTQQIVQQMSANQQKISYYQKQWHYYNQQITFLNTSTTTQPQSIPNIHSPTANPLVPILNSNNYQITINKYQNPAVRDHRIENQRACSVDLYRRSNDNSIDGRFGREMYSTANPNHNSLNLPIQNTYSQQQKLRYTLKNINHIQTNPDQNFELQNKISQQHIRNKQNSNKSIQINGIHMNVYKDNKTTNRSQNMDNNNNPINTITKPTSQPQPHNTPSYFAIVANNSMQAHPSESSKDRDYYSIRDFNSQNKTQSTDESIDELFARVQLKVANTLRGNNCVGNVGSPCAGRMYKKIAPNVAWNDNNTNRTINTCNLGSRNQKKTVQKDIKYNKQNILRKNPQFQISSTIQSFSSKLYKNSQNKNKIKNNSSILAISKKSTQYSYQQNSVSKNSSKYKVNAVRVDVKAACK